MKKKEALTFAKEFEIEFSKIYYEVMGYDEISIYKKTLLSNKSYLLALKYKDFINKLIEEDKKATQKVKNRFKLMIITAVIELVSIFAFPLISFLPFIAEIYVLVSLKKLEKETLTKQDLVEIEKLATEISVIVENISTFLEAKSNKRIERLQNERKNNMEETLKINIANSWLEIVLESNFSKEALSVTLPKEIEEIIIKILQEDLNLEEDNLFVLLDIAKNKIQENSIVLEDELKLTRSKS